MGSLEQVAGNTSLEESGARTRREQAAANSWTFRLTTRSLTATPQTRFLLAFAFVGAALAFRLSLDSLFGDHHPYTLFILATLLTAWFGGIGPALLSIALGFLCADFFFVEPRHTFWIASDPEIAGGTVFFLGISLISAFGGVVMR